MPRLPRLSGARLIEILGQFGFHHVRTKGSHAVLRCRDRVCVVPLHDELAVGTLRGILRQAGIDPEDLRQALNS